MSQQSDIDKMYLFAKVPYEAKYQFLTNKWEGTELKDFNDSKPFIECSKYMTNIYKNIEENHLNNKRKISMVFDDMIDDMLSNKKLNPVVTEILYRGRKLNLSLVFIIKILFYCFEIVLD